MINGAIRRALQVAQGKVDVPTATKPFMPPPPLGRSKKAVSKGSDRQSFDEGGRTPAWTRAEGKNPKGGLNAKGRASAKAEGHNLKPPAPHPKTDAAAARRKSFCSRMKGMKAKLTSSETANDPDSRINKSLRAWNCRADGGRLMDDDIMHALRIAQNRMGYAEGGDVASVPSALDTSVDDQDYSNYINQMLTNLTNNSNFNTPPAMPAPQIDVAQMSAPNPALAMPPAGMNQPPMGGMGAAAGQDASRPFAPPSQDLSSQLANAGFSSQQVNSIMQILQGGQQGQGMARPFAPGPMMPGQGIAPTLAMPPQGGFPATAGVQSNPAMSGAAANPAAAPAAPAPAAGILMPGMGQ